MYRFFPKSTKLSNSSYRYLTIYLVNLVFPVRLKTATFKFYFVELNSLVKHDVLVQNIYERSYT